jgi:hypothetical protein
MHLLMVNFLVRDNFIYVNSCSFLVFIYFKYKYNINTFFLFDTSFLVVNGGDKYVYVNK